MFTNSLWMPYRGTAFPKRAFVLIILLFNAGNTFGRIKTDSIYSFSMGTDVKITMDVTKLKKSKKGILVIYALPNGNTTEQTMGKKMKEGDDWHFDIQHIRAQTKFVRNQLSDENIIVAYLENSFKSWPTWKTKHMDYITLTQRIVDTLYKLIPLKKKIIYLDSHSGGGRFIFDYLDGVKTIPSYIKRISFLDSDYGYDSSYLLKLKTWVKKDNQNFLLVFAYNDSIALYNGKPFVSATGGTWYRSHLMLKELAPYFDFRKTEDDSLVIIKSTNNRIQFFFKTNPLRIIYHTKQVELNGFIHSIFAGTKYDSKGYRYFGKRAYEDLIEE